MIICDDADLAAAASAASMGRFYNCGQACLAIKRVYVFESVADEVIEAITAKAERLKVGRGDAKGLQMGPLHTAAPARRGRRQVARTLDARRRAAVAGGGPPDDPELGRRVLLLADRRRRSSARLADGGRGGVRAGAADLAGDGPRRGDRARERLAVRPGLVGVDARPRRARQAAERIEAGYTWINSRTKVYDELPFGGWKSTRLRQGARRGGVRLLHGDEVGRGSQRGVSGGP